MSSIKVDKLPNGIVRIYYPEKSVITLEKVQHAFSQMLTLIDAPAPIMVLGDRVRYASHDAQEFTCSENYCQWITAQALVARSRLENLLASMYLKTYTTPYPSKSFRSETEAEQWLLQIGQAR
jgi:hypothetical protein